MILCRLLDIDCIGLKRKQIVWCNWNVHGSIFVAFQQLLLRLYLSILTTDWDIWISMRIYIDIYLGMISKISIFSLSAFQCMDMIKRIKSHFNLTTKAIRPHLSLSWNRYKMATSVYHISVGGKYPKVLSNLSKAVPDIHLPYLISVILAQ